MARVKCHSCIYYKKRGRDEEGIICASGGSFTTKTFSTIKWCADYKKASFLQRIRRKFIRSKR